MCIVEPAFIAKQPRQGVVDPKQLLVPAEARCNPEGRLVMANRLLPLGFVGTYNAKNPMRLTDPVFFTLLREELNCTKCGFFCSVKLVVPIQCKSERNQTISLLPYVPNPFKDSQCFLRSEVPSLLPGGGLASGSHGTAGPM